jgi:hypothetical protein
MVGISSETEGEIADIVVAQGDPSLPESVRMGDPGDIFNEDGSRVDETDDTDGALRDAEEDEDDDFEDDEDDDEEEETDDDDA